MTIIFLNTWHSTLRTELRDYIARHTERTDIFCFQEALTQEQTVYEDLLTNYAVYYEAKEEGDLSYGNVIYVRKSLEVVDHGVLLKQVSDVGLAVYVVVKTGETTTTVCNVHGIPYPGDKLDTPERLRQSRAVIEQFAGTSRMVIGGDFNLLPEAHSVKLFAEHGYRNLIDEYAIQTTRNYIAHEKYPDSPQYYADYTFVTPDMTVRHFAVPDDVISDHQPLELSIEV